MKALGTMVRRGGVALVVGTVIVIVIGFVTLFGAWLAPYDPYQINHFSVLQVASAEHPMGTDEFGRDILSRLLIGIRPTMTVALGSTLLAAAAGSALGILAGFAGRFWEFGIMRTTDIMLSFPPILLALLVVGFWQSGVVSLTITIGILYMPHFARVAHSATIQVSRFEFIEAERSLGATPIRIILTGIVPNILSPIVVQATLTVAAAILLESGLSFLGLGIKPPEPSWGQMIGMARGYLAQNPMYTFWPSIFLAATVLAINLIGDRLRDILDPTLFDS